MTEKGDVSMYNNNPYINYGNIQPTFQPAQQKQKVLRVNGENGARSLQLAPGSDALVLDETAPLVWLVQTDDAGYKTVTAYDITPHHTEPEQSLADRLDAIDARLKKLEEEFA